MPIIPELVRFLRRPVFTAERVPMNANALTELFKLLGLALVLAVLSVMIVGMMYSFSSGDMPETSKDFDAMSQGGQFFLLAVIIAPLTEELLFRSWQGRVWGVILVMPTILALFAMLVLLNHSEALGAISTLGVAIVMGSLGLYLQRYFQTKPINGLHEAATQQMFPYVFWGSAAVFALIHISNYASAGFQPLLILLVTPQFIVGAILGVVRMRYGILQAIGFHAAYNGVFVGLSFLG